ncbi:MAG: aminoacyl-tRNA hydrolase [Spirochaetaceae bacterium]|jgi:PTH1 family peptidyl-tRNA hydrolase|nr:aminoacyl-tRNA hydrolase [Spirochaetaceae bacterium]
MNLPEIAVFLGNPGEQYRNTRHNAGWLLAERISALPALSLNWGKKFKGSYTPAMVNSANGQRKCHFLLPETFMNNSGEAVQAALLFFKIKPESLLVVHDELELKLGQAGFKFGGGLGGHNGLRSLAACLGTPDFWRLRLGIGRPGGIKEKGQDITSWVLGRFTNEETSLFSLVLDTAAGSFLQALERGPQSLLPEWNKKTVLP